MEAQAPTACALPARSSHRVGSLLLSYRRATSVRRCPLVLQYFDCRCTKSKLVEDRRPILEVLDPRGASQVFGHNDGVAGHRAHALERAVQPSAISVAYDRSVRPKEVDAS